MRAKTRHLKGRCGVCGGELRQTTITHEERRGTNLFLFQNVPAEVCPEATLQVIDRLIREGEPIRKVETPVYDFTLAGVK